VTSDAVRASFSSASPTTIVAGIAFTISNAAGKLLEHISAALNQGDSLKLRMRESSGY